MKIETEEFFSIEKCRENPNKLFVYGSNLKNVGKGGQAIIRDELNTFGISTKYSVFASYSDKELSNNKMYIDNDIEELKIFATEYDCVVFPKMGIGTGLAALQTRSPRTFIYLCTKLLDEFGFNNLAYLIPVK